MEITPLPLCENLFSLLYHSHKKGGCSYGHTLRCTVDNSQQDNSSSKVVLNPLPHTSKKTVFL
jgi:hypothetical protein